ncbi:MAG TPA: ribosome recycling factor [bacterium]|jgi:ribosome recycling factor|nr:ribosome recycling factor [bacterium]MDX9805667.1 ribosome recycling factor [bacterium]HNW15298.1 ribosome recycling factor [bacterium]HOB70214.1 ribosome recycling factor [bacterium]HPA56420.1 ribosome recycling factor [bacterium]
MFEQKAFFDDLKDKFDKSIDAYKTEIAQYRTGKATPKLLDGIFVDYYGARTPLNQMASVTTPDARLILVQPYDRSVLKGVETAIRNANLGFNPVNDGANIKVPVPSLTEERRKDLVKQLHQLTEKYRVSMRNLRRDALAEIKRAEKDKEITEDEEKKFSDKVQKDLNDFIKKLDDIAKVKENDIIEL